MRFTIWRLTWSHARGAYWLAMRQCDDYLAGKWLDVFRQDEPCATYRASVKAPPLGPGDVKHARHVATA